MPTPPVGGRLVYLWDDDSDGAFYQIYSAPLAGPADQQIRLNPTLPPGRTVSFFVIAPDGSRVAYIADPTTAGVLELFSMPLAGPAEASTWLNKPLPEGSSGLYLSGDTEPRFLPDSSRVVYAAEQDVADRRLLLDGFESGTTSAWSATVP